MRTELPDTVGRTNIRTELFASAGIVCRAFCETVHADSHRGCPCACAAEGAMSAAERTNETASASRVDEAVVACEISGRRNIRPFGPNGAHAVRIPALR